MEEVLRETDGNSLQNETVSLQFKINETTANGATVYAQTESITTNVGNVGGNSSRIETFTVSGASPGDVVFVSPSENLQSQVITRLVCVLEIPMEVAKIQMEVTVQLITSRLLSNKNNFRITTM